MVTFILAACSSEDYTDDPIFDQEIKTELVDKSQLPEWLADYVTYLEYTQIADASDNKSGVLRFIWKDQYFYELYTPYQSTAYDNLYTSDGKPFYLQKEDYLSFSQEVRDWTIVYVLQKSSEVPKYSYYPEAASEDVKTFFDKVFEDGHANNGMNFITSLSPINDDLIEYTTPPYICFLINSEETLRKIYTGSEPLPQIDFSKYSLILGRTHIYNPDSRDLTLNRHAIIDNDSVVFKVYFEHQDKDKGQKDKSNHYYFWSLYPKLPFDHMTYEQFIDNEMKIVCTFDNLNPYIPHTTKTKKPEWVLSSTTDEEGELHEGDIYKHIYFGIADGSFKADHSASRFCARVLSYNCSGIFKIKELQDSLQDVRGEIQIKVDECEYYSDFVNTPSPWPFIRGFELMDHFSLQGDSLLTFEDPKGRKMCFSKYVNIEQ
jgi:hypothetical protein